MDYGASGVKAVALARDRGGLRVLGTGVETVESGAVRDGVVRDPDAVGAALRRLIPRLGVKSRLVGLALGGSLVFVKRFPAPPRIGVSDRGKDEFRLTVAQEAARHVPFHLDSLEFDYEAPTPPVRAAMPGDSTAGEPGAIVFGAAPREVVGEHCRVATLAGREVARVGLEAYALYRAAELTFSGSPKDGDSSGLVIVEIGAGRAGVHVFRGCPAPGARPEGSVRAGGTREAGGVPDLLASVPLSGTVPAAGSDAMERSGSPDPPGASVGGVEAGSWRNGQTTSEEALDRVVAAVGEALPEAVGRQQTRILLSGGGASAPRVRHGLQALGLGEPVLLNPLGSLGAPKLGPRYTVAAGMAYQQILDASKSRRGQRS